jgi:hypothetical protein
MSTARYVQRSVAVLASAGATAALTLLPATGAHASVAGMYAAAAVADASFQGSGGGDCTLTSASGSDDVQSSIKNFNHGTKHASATGKATFTNTLNSSDKVTVKTHVDSAMTLRKKHNDLSVFDLTVGGSVVVNHTVTGSQCRGSGEAIGETAVNFTEHKKGWLTLTRDTKKPNSFVEFIIVNAKNGQPVTLEIYQGDKSHSVSRALLKPGHYAIAQGIAGITAGGGGIFAKAQSQSRSARVAQTIHIRAEFAPLKK